MVSPFDCVAAQDMGMADAERKYLHRHCERSEAIQNGAAKDWIASSQGLLAMTWKES
jgi:hypothetical protein